MFHGSMVALVTPMREDGAVDNDSLDALIELHVLEGTDAIVAVGTTGESATQTKKSTVPCCVASSNRSMGDCPS